ncbi:MAG TPA: aldo/keto reductase [Candidatus Limicola stercorigallinarum]|nr:aldo/keto reductase [Candidatus Limicola stercorigallinarum]
MAAFDEVQGKLGFGLMRLPKVEDASGERIDLGQVERMVDAFLDAGLTYFDTAYVYHDGQSECVARKALVERHPREAFTLATKLPAWKLEKPEDMQRIFDEQLERTGAGFFDYYLLHNVADEHIGVYERMGAWEWAQRLRDKGLIRHLGFSFHDTADVLDRLLTEHPEVEFVQLQINYLDWGHDVVQSGACYEVAERHGVPVVVMEPVKGGTLAKLPEDVAAPLTALDASASQASWALRFAASLSQVKMVLSGMSTEAQMADNLATLAPSAFKPLTQEERDALHEVVSRYTSVETVGCTACRYCTPGCPQGIDIPAIISCVNNRRRYRDGRSEMAYQRALTAGSARASACVACGQCESACPQHLPIIEVLKEAAEAFDTKEE